PCGTRSIGTPAACSGSVTVRRHATANTTVIVIDLIISSLVWCEKKDKAHSLHYVIMDPVLLKGYRRKRSVLRPPVFSASSSVSSA
ncbi:MAG: hypothetical protein ACKO9V_04550, partial [Candidatus Kapaibacterium sp.]